MLNDNLPVNVCILLFTISSSKSCTDHFRIRCRADLFTKGKKKYSTIVFQMETIHWLVTLAKEGRTPAFILIRQYPIVMKLRRITLSLYPIIYLHGECIEKYHVEICSTYDKEHHFRSYLEKPYFVPSRG